MHHTEVAYDWIVVIDFQRVRNEEIGRLFHRPSVRSGKGLCSMALMIKRCFRTGLVFQADGIRYMNMLKKKKKKKAHYLVPVCQRKGTMECMQNGHPEERIYGALFSI